MKKLLGIVVVGLLLNTSVGAEEFNFQKVYEIPGKSADEIRTAFGETKFVIEETGLNKISGALDLVVGKTKKSENTGKIICDISPKLLPRINENFDGDIILETKEGRYRLTITNMISTSGVPLTKMTEYAQKACKKDLKKWADSKFEQVKAFNSDW
mgnify:FL=1